MHTVGILELQDRLPEYVKRAAAGERILVTDHNQIVAELTPPAQTPAASTDPAIADLIRRGLATPPRLAKAQPPKTRGNKKLAEILDDLATDRADR